MENFTSLIKVLLNMCLFLSLREFLLDCQFVSGAVKAAMSAFVREICCVRKQRSPAKRKNDSKVKLQARGVVTSFMVKCGL